MLPFGWLAVVWIAAIVIGRKSNANMPHIGQSDEKLVTGASPEIERMKVEIDALKAIGASAFQRWEKRRNYEWQLSFSIWTASAAFIGIVLNGNFTVASKERVALWVAVAGVLITAFHGIYLWRMFSDTIGDAHITRWAEQKLYETAFSNQTIPQSVMTKTGTPKVQQLYPDMRKYGVIQIAITGVLALAAFGAIHAPRNPPGSSNPPVVINTSATPTVIQPVKELSDDSPK
jgi:hypothetical protein